MNNHKLKKNVTHHDSRTSIKNVETRFYNNLLKKKNSLPQKKVYVEELERTLGTPGLLQHAIVDLQKEIKDIKQEIYDIESNKEEIEYNHKLSKFIDECYISASEATKKQKGETFFTKTSSTNAGEKFNIYMEICFGSCKTENPPERHILLCQYCTDSHLVIETHTATAICQECGVSIPYQDETTNPEFREGVQIISPYAYKRINHFKEWLAQLQAKESTEIPEEVFNSILVELKKRRVNDAKRVTTALVRNILKSLRYNKFYEHIPTIIQRITGKHAPSLSPELETHLVTMFREIQEPFAKHVKIVAPERKNFLSYSYTLNKMCELLGETDLLQYFPLLKSREKNYVQDQIWKGICADLGWQFNRSV